MKKVLIVEDNPDWSCTLKETFTRAGFKVVGIASNKAEALELALSQNPDVITMDGSLLGGDKGLDIAMTIRSQGIKSPIIMVSGSEEEFEGRGLWKGSFSREDLLMIVAESITASP